MISPAPKPRKKRQPKRRFSSIKRPSKSAAQQAAQKLREGSKRPKATNPKRRKSEFARCYGSKERVEFVKSLPCVVGWATCAGPIQNHHIKTGGTGRKADARFIMPLCQRHHNALHCGGRQFFESYYNVHMETAAAKTELAWQHSRQRGK